MPGRRSLAGFAGAMQRCVEQGSHQGHTGGAAGACAQYRASAHEGPGCWRHTLVLTSVMGGVGRLLLYDELWRVRDVLQLASKEIYCVA